MKSDQLCVECSNFFVWQNVLLFYLSGKIHTKLLLVMDFFLAKKPDSILVFLMRIAEVVSFYRFSFLDVGLYKSNSKISVKQNDFILF